MVIAASLLSCSPPAAPGGSADANGSTRWSAQLTQRLGGLVPDDPARAERWSRLPSIEAASAGIPADGLADATRQLQDAIDSLRAGGTLVLGPGTYRHSQCLLVRTANVRIIGRGATLYASNPEHPCLLVEADGFELSGLVLTANLLTRRDGLEQARIAVRGSGARIAGNTIDGSSSAAIWMHGARDFVISGNHVRNSLSDGIHLSDGSRNGRISGNTVSGTYDDGIAVVSYLAGARCHDVLIERNDVSGVIWGRGISVVGSSQVLIRENRIDSITRAAGILVAQEWSFQTYGAAGVVVTGNRVSRVAAAPRSAAASQTGHASIELNSSDFRQGAYAVSRVMVAGNRIEDSPAPGIRLLGQTCDVELGANTFNRVAGPAVEHAGAVCVTEGNECLSSSARVAGRASTIYCPSGSGRIAKGS